MRKKLVPCIALIALAIASIGLASHNPASAAVANWQQGASIVPSSSTDFASSNFKQSLSNLAGTNANFVTLIIHYFQSDIHSTDIQKSGITPTDDSLIEGIKYAHSLGLGVNLTLHVGSRDGEWRAHINPSDRAGWFRAYGAVLDHYAGIAQAHNVEQMTLGAELIKMAAANQNPSNTSYWRDMISSVRGIYSGKLTYSANWGDSGWVNEKDAIEFWDALDYIGIAAYFEFSQPYSMESLSREWNVWNDTHIKPLQRKYNKPVLFTEVGYRSTTGALNQPWNYEMNNGPNEQEQADGYEALFSYWNDQSFMQGVHLWDWESDPDAGGPNTTSYTPQNKKAQGVMTKWFASSAPSPPPSFTASATINPSKPVVNQSVTIAVEVKNSGGTVNNALVDIELYNSSNQRVFQRFFEGQSFSSGQARSYSVNWTPTSSGNYIVKLGVFSAGWQENYFWDSNAGTIEVQGSSATPTPTPTRTPNPAPTPTPAPTATPAPSPTQEPGGVTRIVAVSASADDAYAGINPGWPGYSSTTHGIYVGAPGSNGPVVGGWRFTGLAIPAGAKIIDAYLEINQQHWGYNVTTSLTFEDSAAPGSFSSAATPAHRLLNPTTFRTTWTWGGPASPGAWFRTPSLAEGLQELVDTYGAIQQVVVLEDGTGVTQGRYHYWASFDSGPAVAAKLVVTY